MLSPSPAAYADLSKPAGVGGGSGLSESEAWLVSTGAQFDAALCAISDDFRTGDSGNYSVMHYMKLAGDIDAVSSATYGNEDDDHPVRVTIDGDGHSISGAVPTVTPVHAAGNKYTGLRFANRTVYTNDPSDNSGRGNYIILKNLTVKGLYNAETHGGGALAVFGGRLDADNCVFQGNAAFGTSRGGGAILLQHRASVLSVSNSTFTNNSSVAPGGAIDSSGDQANVTPGTNVTIENSTFYANKSTGETGNNGPGGAISFGRALGSVTNCTIVGNTAANGIGGGVYARWNISGNASGLGTKAEISLVNSIVTGNGSGDYSDIDASNIAASSDIISNHNLIGSADARFIDSGTVTGVDTGEALDGGAPKVNRRGSPTIALTKYSGSPAIDRADPDKAPATDQRGYPRGSQPDIGAYEALPGLYIESGIEGDASLDNPWLVGSGQEFDEALMSIAEDYSVNSDGMKYSVMHYIKLTGDIDAVSSATYGEEDNDHPVRVTVDGDGHSISGTVPTVTPVHAAGNKYTGLRFANRTVYTNDPSDNSGRGNYIILKNLTVKGLYNAETHGGGALAVFGGRLDADNCVFQGNAAFGTSRGGGAILLQHRASVLSVSNSTFINNSSVAPGGAIDSSGDQANVTPGTNVTIKNSTFYANRSTATAGNNNGPGGAISFGRALGSVTNCTIVGNTAANGVGGGVYARWNISGNASGLGTKAEISLVNSIVAGNGYGDYTDIDISNEPVSSDIISSHNVIGSVHDAFSDASSTTGAVIAGFLRGGAPMVNGRGTPTIALLETEDSPAIDKADPDKAPATDQRGYGRIGNPDIGAYETQSEPDEDPDDDPADDPDDGDGEKTDTSGGGCDAGAGLAALIGLGALQLRGGKK